MECVPDRIHRGFAIFEEIAAPDARDAEASGFEVLGADGVELGLFGSGVLGAVEFENEFGAEADEVGDVITERDLSPEFEIGEAAIA